MSSVLIGQSLEKFIFKIFQVKDYIYDVLHLVNNIKQNIYQLCA